MKTIIGIPNGAIMDQNLYNNPHISPTAYHALRRAVEPYCLYTIGEPYQQRQCGEQDYIQVLARCS